MLDIAPSELILVAVVALVVIGPKDLPRVMRVVGHWVGKARGMARHFRSGFDEMIRQSELDEMQKKWSDENARIMAEHPSPPPEDTDAGLSYYDQHYAPAAALPAPEVEAQAIGPEPAPQSKPPRKRKPAKAAPDEA